MNSSLAKEIFKFGARARNPSLFEQYHYLKSTEWLSREDLQKLQLDNAKSFLAYVEKASPYYQRILKKVGFSASDFSKLSDIGVIPEISKSTLINNNAEIHTTGLSEKMILAETSGTSGVALKFQKNERWDSCNRAVMMRSYDWYDVKPWDRNGYLWGYNLNEAEALKVKLLDAFQNRFRLFNYTSKGVEEFCSKLKGAQFISGYSSMIFEVAKTINTLGLSVPRLKLVKGTSEMILDAYHKEVRAAFGCKIVSEYGAAESGLIAFECPEGNQHINIENLILELNESGELLVTNLSSYSFPIIRYNLGDVVDVDYETSCPCGRQHPLIKNIRGRKGVNVVGSTGSKYPGLTFYYVFKNLALQKDLLLNYKVEQHEAGTVEVFIEGTENVRYENNIMEELNRYFGEDVIFNIYYVKEFSMGGKKRQYFSSFIS